MCCRFFGGNSVNTFLTWKVGIETEFLGAFDVYGIPIPSVAFFWLLFFRERKVTASPRPAFKNNWLVV